MYMENVYRLEKLSEAATSIDMRADKGICKDDCSSTKCHEFVSTITDECRETDEAVAYCKQSRSSKHGRKDPREQRA